MKNEKTGNRKPDSASSCFLTTAAVGALGLPDDCEPLELARHLRDEKMKSGKDRAAVALYNKIAPVIVARSTNDDWLAFWRNHMCKITALIKSGEYQLAKELYTYATASLIKKKAVNYSDNEMVDNVYEYGLHGVGQKWLPYPIRFGLLRAALFAGLSYQSVRLGLAKRKFPHIFKG